MSDMDTETKQCSPSSTELKQSGVNSIQANRRPPIRQIPRGQIPQIPQLPYIQMTAIANRYRTQNAPLSFAMMPKFQIGPNTALHNLSHYLGRSSAPLVSLQRTLYSSPYINQSTSSKIMGPVQSAPAPSSKVTSTPTSTPSSVPTEPNVPTATATDEASESQVESADFDHSEEHGNLALLMHEKWLKRILYYGKSWEIRGRNTHIRGKIYLAFKNHIYGETHITDSFPITIEELQTNTKLHHVEDLSIVTYKTPHIWMLDKTIRYNKPIKFPRKQGQITFCCVNMDNLRGNEIIETEVSTKNAKRKAPSSTSKKGAKRRKIGKNSKVTSKRKSSPKLKKVSKSPKSKTSKKKNLPKGVIDPTDGALTVHQPDLSKALTTKQWAALIDTDIFSCCNKKVGGPAVMCDECDGEWHIYCMLKVYHINKREVTRIQKEGEPFVCVDCHRRKLGKIPSL